MKSIGDIRRREKNQGFTIVEVVIAALIFAVAAAGLYATITATRQPAVEKSQDVTAALVGKRILDGLRSENDQGTWTSGSLLPGTYTLNAITVGGTTYQPSYRVEADPNGTQARRVTLNITW